MSDHKYAYPLILNKVASPQYATPTLRRARLIDWLNEAAGCRAAVIAADAGYGKTTLLWQWEREVDFPCYWYKLDRNDRDWTLHISYLAESIAKRHPGFGRRTHSMLEQMGGPGSSRPGVTAYLLAEMHRRLTEPCTFIIDDWHYVNAVTEVRGLWNQILRDAPSTCRFIFASRVKPKLQFARFKTHGGYAEIRTDALRFTEPEIDELFRDIYHDPLEPNEVAELERRTEGWAASLQLVEVSLRDRRTPEERQEFISSITATRDSDLFDFLAEEVLDQQPEETRNFLLSTSILQQITPEVAERLTGTHDGRRSLNDLEQRGLFTNRLDDERFRFHPLFRDFLERRLVADRSESEVIGLHIHAASYFETSAQWPEAIHHYLHAGLHRQAARLIAKHGEHVVSEGRLGLVDEWLRRLPGELIRGNARLSLLFGEACGIRGEWQRATDALGRAREYFHRKGDRRLEALACLKLSSVYSNLGDPESAIGIAEVGAGLVPADDAATRLRLAGNLAITRTWLADSLAAVSTECLKVGDEAATLGMEHFAAIGWHNAGCALNRMGKFDLARTYLERAAVVWGEQPTSPFADNAELVDSLLALGLLDRARAVANEAVNRTAPWPRPQGDALGGLASVLISEGRAAEAIGVLESAMRYGNSLGGIRAVVTAKLIEALWLDNRHADIGAHALDLTSERTDPRYTTDYVAARVIGAHVHGDCGGSCLDIAAEYELATARGDVSTALVGRVKLGAIALTHSGLRRKAPSPWLDVVAARDAGLWPSLRPWLRLYAPHARTAMKAPDGAILLASLALHDPDPWRGALVEALGPAKGNDRRVLLAAISRVANRETTQLLADVPGQDVQELRRQLRYSQAPRLYLQTLGGVVLRRADWEGPPVAIEKKRVRSLLGVLAAHHGSVLSRDAALEMLWPEADPDSAINSLNQAVFQLRRHIDSTYRANEGPEYVISTSEHIGLNADLVHTDLSELRRLPQRTANADWPTRQRAASRAIRLVRGEFLADLPYEDWAQRHQLAIHGEIRELLLPIASSPATSYEVEISLQAAMALVRLDPFDESAVLSLADCLSRSGRRAAARKSVVDFVGRLQKDLDLNPSRTFEAAASAILVN